MESEQELRSHASNKWQLNRTLSSCEQQEYDKKISSMKKYIPFLKNTICDLEKKQTKDRHLGAAKRTYDVLTNPNIRIEMQTLLRLETIWKKVYDKRQSSDSDHYKDEAEIIENRAVELKPTSSSNESCMSASGTSSPLGEEDTPSKRAKIDLSSSVERREDFNQDSSGAGKHFLSQSGSPPNTHLTTEGIGRHHGLPPSALQTLRHNDRLLDRRKAFKKSDQEPNQGLLGRSNNQVQKTDGRSKDFFPGEGRSTQENELVKRIPSPQPAISNYVLKPISLPLPNLPSKHGSQNLSGDNLAGKSIDLSVPSDPRLTRGRQHSLHSTTNSPPSKAKSSTEDCERTGTYKNGTQIHFKENEILHSSSMPSSSSGCISGISSINRESLNKLSRSNADFCDDESPGMLEEKQVFQCKHCSYVGKKIIPHTVNRHPHAEVPVRLPEEELEEALKEQNEAPAIVKNISKADDPVDWCS